MINLEELNDVYTISHLTNNDDLSTFVIENPKGIGLQYYLQENAKADEQLGIARTYLLKTNDTNEIVAYFTLRTGLITVSRGIFKGFNDNSREFSHLYRW